MLLRMTAEDLTEWEAYYQLEPFGPIADNFNHGRMATIMLNVNRQKKSAPYKFEDIALGDFGERKQGLDTMKNLLMGLVDATKQKAMKQKTTRRKRKKKKDA
jgi:hypothetical protein